MEVVKLRQQMSANAMSKAAICWLKYLFGFDHILSQRQPFKMFARAHTHSKDIMLPIYQ